MDDKTKDGYLVSGGFILVGLVFLYSGWGNFDLVFFIGIGLAGLGIAGFKWPSMAEILLHWVKKQEKANSYNSKQTQRNTKNSNQVIAQGNSKIKIENYYYPSSLPEEKTSNEKKDLIKEIHHDLTKEKLSNTLIKCIRLANIINSKKDVFWLENESKGFGGEVRIRKDEDDIPDYRLIDTEIRITSNASEGYTTLDYKLALGMPIFQIEEWIDSYKKTNQPSEMILNAPMSETFKKVYKNVLKKDPPKQNIPYIIRISELRKILNGLKLRISKFLYSVN